MDQQSKEQVVFLEANSVGNGLLGGGPAYAKLVVGSRFVAQLNRLSNLCEKEALSEVHISYGPDMWGPDGIEEQMRMACPRLVVSRTGFYFAGQGKYMEGHIETPRLELKEFFEALANANGPIYLGADPAGLEQTVLEDAPDDEGEPEAEAFR